MQVKQIETEKKELNSRLQNLSRRIDHTERAYRREEIPLLAKTYEEQKKADRENHENAAKLLLEATKRQHEKDIHLKSRLLQIQDDVKSFKKQLDVKFAERLKILRAESVKKIAVAKEKRIAEVKAKKAAELERKKREEEEARAAEEAKRLEEEENELREQGSFVFCFF
jgi:translation initiation factor 3 subunit A